MIFSLILLFFVLALVFMAKGRRRAAYVSLGSALLLVFGFGSGPLTRAVLDPLQGPHVASDVPRQWAPRSAIVVLGMGNSQITDDRVEPNPLAFGRVRMASVAYQSCKAAGSECKVIFSGGAEQARNGQAEAATYAREAQQLGIPAKDIVVEDKSRNTWENAKNTRPILEQMEPGQIYLVTSGVHLERSLLYFAHHGIRAVPIRPDFLQPLPGLLPQAYNIGVADVALGEYKGFLQYRLYNALGLNDPPSKALNTTAAR